MQTQQRIPRKMRRPKPDERENEHPQTWFRDEDIARAKALAAHVRETGTLPRTGQENGS